MVDFQVEGPDRPTAAWLSIVVDLETPNGRAWERHMQPIFDALPAAYAESPTLFSCPYFSAAEGLTESAAPTYSAMATLNRVEPLLVYTGAASRYVDVTFHLRATGVNGMDPKKEVENSVYWLQSLNGPVYDIGHWRFSPPPVYVNVGAVLRMRAVVESVAAQWLGPWSVDETVGASPHGCDVSVRFCSVSRKFWSDQRGIQDQWVS